MPRLHARLMWAPPPPLLLRRACLLPEPAFPAHAQALACAPAYCCFCASWKPPSHACPNALAPSRAPVHPQIVSRLNYGEDPAMREPFYRRFYLPLQVALEAAAELHAEAFSPQARRWAAAAGGRRGGSVWRGGTFAAVARLPPPLLPLAELCCCCSPRAPPASQLLAAGVPGHF